MTKIRGKSAAETRYPWMAWLVAIPVNPRQGSGERKERKGGNEGTTRSDVVAERGIDIRPLEREEAVTHYQEASRWVHTLRAGELTLAPPPP